MGTRTRLSVPEAGYALSEARKQWAEAFLRYRAADPSRTDGQARAMADLDVDLAGAEVDWVIAREAMKVSRLSVLAELLLGEDEDAGSEPTERSN